MAAALSACECQRLFLLCVVLIGVFLSLCNADETSIVSCGSVIKLKHKETGHHLHSHAIAWGSGSGQQSVTGHGSNNGLFFVSNSSLCCPICFEMEYSFIFLMHCFLFFHTHAT
jgi:dolichyl-phosphate-mannose--protein O-mannosyl transferase